jgi:general secretion pathway protein A
MYEEYYGFDQPPFSLTPDPRFLYRSDSHDLALEQVWQAIRRKEGFIVLSGDIGTGKTTLCRTLLEQFDATTFTALILNPFLSVEELLRDVLLSFGIASREALRTGRLATASKHELVRTLHDFLLSLIPLHGSAVLIIDEAQHLSPDVLEEIRVLSNLETTEQKLLQIVLVGQLNLLDLLRQQNMRQLDQRISIRCMLKALNREELEAYVTHRLWVVRGSTSVIFTAGGLDAVYAITSGVPRMINLVCDRALMAGHAAETDKITEAEVISGANALGLPIPAGLEPRQRRALRGATGTRGRRTALLTASLLVVALLGSATYLLGHPASWFDTVAVTQPAAPAPWTRPALLPVHQYPDQLPALTPPAPLANSLSVLVGQFEDAAAATRASERLLGLDLPVYIVDVRPTAEGAVRRVLVGRFTSRAEATALQAMLAAEFEGARLVYAWQESMRILP